MVEQQISNHAVHFRCLALLLDAYMINTVRKLIILSDSYMQILDTGISGTWNIAKMQHRSKVALG